jgi:hypothetical protein
MNNISIDGSFLSMKYKKPEKELDNIEEFLYNISDSFLEVKKIGLVNDEFYDIELKVTNSQVLKSILDFSETNKPEYLHQKIIYKLSNRDKFMKVLSEIFYIFFNKKVRIHYMVVNSYGITEDVVFYLKDENNKDIVLTKIFIDKILRISTNPYIDCENYKLVTFDISETLIFFANKNMFHPGDYVFTFGPKKENGSVEKRKSSLCLRDLYNKDLMEYIQMIENFFCTTDGCLFVHSYHDTKKLRNKILETKNSYYFNFHLSKTPLEPHLINLWEIEEGILSFDKTNTVYIYKSIFCYPYNKVKKLYRPQELEEIEDIVNIITDTINFNSSPIDLMNDEKEKQIIENMINCPPGLLKSVSLQSLHTPFSRITEKESAIFNISYNELDISDYDIVMKKSINIYSLFKTLKIMIEDYNFPARNLKNVKVNKDYSFEINFTSMIQKKNFENVFNNIEKYFVGFIIEDKLSYILSIRNELTKINSHFEYPVFDLNKINSSLQWSKIIKGEQYGTRALTKTSSFGTKFMDVEESGCYLILLQDESCLMKILNKPVSAIRQDWLDTLGSDKDFLNELEYKGYRFRRSEFLNCIRVPTNGKYISSQRKYIEKFVGENYFYGIREIGNTKGVLDFKEDKKYFNLFDFKIINHVLPFQHHKLFDIQAHSYLMITDKNNSAIYTLPLLFIDKDDGIYWIIQSFLQGMIFNDSYYEIYINYGKIPKIYPFGVKDIKEQRYFDTWYENLISDCVEKENLYKQTVNMIIKDI